MKYPCNLIRDILPLYHDQVASEDSINAINQHLEECKECKEYYERMCSSDVIESVADDEQMAIKAADSYKKVRRRIWKTIWKIICGIILMTAVLLVIIYVALIAYFEITAKASEKRYDDVSGYSTYRSGENAIGNFKVPGMDEIWPEEITADMTVRDYLMMYYNPWDANYLGFLVVEYSETDYEAEVLRLQEYPSTDYIGYYGAKGFESFEVLAMEAGYDGFVYAIADGKNLIIYVELVFPGYGMDIDYEKYIPEKYLPRGLDATKGNPVQKKVIEENERKRRQ